jgi:hypothetical protein
MHTTLNRIIGGVLLSAGIAVAGVGLGAATAHAGAFHWCPGNPPITAAKPGGGTVTINPDWDTTVCHDYVIFAGSGQVAEGNPCNLPQFQWFQCPPGTTPVPQMPLIPNK